MEIKTPFINQGIGAGDVIASLTEKVGIKPCSGCKKRRTYLNEVIKFVPKAQWTAPPEVPEGWILVKSVDKGDRIFSMFSKGDSSFIIWEIIDGKYRNSHSFCCGAKDTVDKKWDTLVGV